MTVGVDTKQRILDVAEQMFAEYGFAGASLRRIIAEAGVNLAAVHYHFHSKESLLEAVLMRRMVPLNEERMSLLDELERNAPKEGAALEDIVGAVLGPPMRLILSPSGEGRMFGKLIGRLHSETGGQFGEFSKKHFAPVAERFTTALQRTLPNIPKEELFWRIHFSVGAMAHTLSCWDQMETLSHGQLRPSNVESVIPLMIGFIAAGLRAPAVNCSRQRRTKGTASKRRP